MGETIVNKTKKPEHLLPKETYGLVENDSQTGLVRIVNLSSRSTYMEIYNIDFIKREINGRDGHIP
jgi:hypothetical protein